MDTPPHGITTAPARNRDLSLFTQRDDRAKFIRDITQKGLKNTLPVTTAVQIN